jgi:hypothetical protein
LWARTNTSVGTSAIITWFGQCDYLTFPELKIFMNGPNFKLLEEILRSDYSKGKVIPVTGHEGP